MVKTRLLALAPVLVLATCTVARAQDSGGIRGLVLDSDFDAPLPEARVTIAETGDATTTSETGNYLFSDLPPGTYTIVFAKDGYARQVRADVVVMPARLTELDAELTGDFTEMEEFVVQDVQLGTATEIGLLELRMETPALIDSVSSELMGRAGASDAASALTLVSGATVEDGKYAVVRGLPDRYVIAQLNGIRLPTADAEKKAVQLDQFPASAIDSIQVSKTFTPDQQGDASGGAVNIVLKGVPDETFFKVSGSTSVNTRNDDRDDFLSYEGSGFDYWGRDENDSRDVFRQPLGGNWSGAVGTRTKDTPENYKYSVELGARHELTDDIRVGGLGNFYYERGSSFIQDAIDDEYWITEPGAHMTPVYSQGAPDEAGGGDFKTDLFDVTRSSEEIKWGALGVVGIESDYHRLTLTGLFTRDVSDEATVATDTRGKEYFFPGYDRNDPLDPGNIERQAAPYLRLETLKTTERETRTLQLSGWHKSPDPGLEIDGFFAILSPELDWSISQSSANLKEPDKRQFGTQYQAATLNPGFPPFVPPFEIPEVQLAFKPAANFTIGNLQRVSKEINEESSQRQVNLKLPFTQWTETEGFLKFGLFSDEVDRTYEQDSFSNFGDNDSFYRAPFEDPWSAVFPFEDHPITAGEIDVDYEGEQNIEAAYFMADIPLTGFLSIIGGKRYESTEISIVNFPEEDVTWFPPGTNLLTTLNPGDADVSYEQDDILPMIGFRLTPIRQIVIRGSYSETVARQTFRELSPILQQEFLGSDIFIGNPLLVMSDVTNRDLRVDYTPYQGGLLSVSYFEKDIDLPIEYVQRIGNGFTYTTPVNYPEGTLSGWEFEARQDLERLWDPLSGLTIGANLTLIESEVELTPEEIAAFAAPEVLAPLETRDMTNAPEHLYNLFFIYNLRKLGLAGTTLATFYTVRGDTLTVGATTSDGNLVPSVYELEYGTLNASVTQKLWEGWELKLQAKNLLDPDIKTVYRSDYLDRDVTKTSYQKGIEYSIGLSATF